jgi:hypothetical protein
LDDLVLPGLVVPGVALAAASGLASAVWSYVTQRRLARLTARLGAEGIVLEAVQGRRVAAAVELWSESAAFEQALRDLLAPFHDLTLDEDASREERRLGFAEHETRAARTLAALFPKLMRATATAECLLPSEAGRRARRLAEEYSSAHACYWASRAEDDRAEKRAARDEARAVLARALETRARLLEELRAVLDGGGAARP